MRSRAVVAFRSAPRDWREGTKCQSRFLSLGLVSLEQRH